MNSFEIFTSISKKGNPYLVVRLHFRVKGQDRVVDLFGGNKTDLLKMYWEFSDSAEGQKGVKLHE